ncbi:MAG: penicillin-binding transpeptidase domain-containing protein, partial [Chloroflexota bacterium]
PHFALYARDRLVEKYGAEAVYGGGLQVITSIDLDVQEQVLQYAREQIAALQAQHNVSNAAVVVLDTKRAEILAMVGSLDYGNKDIDGSVNMALAPRQPGSSFKPFTYATAFAQGYTPASMVMDVRTSFPDPPNPAPYVPENYSRNYHGPMLLRRALACSYNIPAVAMNHRVGSDNVVKLAHLMGINTLRSAHYGLSLTLGGGEVSLLDMTYAFTVFANGGAMLGEPVPSDQFEPGFRRLDPVAILRVTDAKGRVLYDYKEPRRQEVIRPEIAYLITDILADNRARTPAFGANSVLNLGNLPAAAKTGTTNNYHDGWAIGYTPQYAVGVWVGNADYTPMKNLAGVRGAGPIWNKLMLHLHDGLPIENFARPPGLVTTIVDATSGKLPTRNSRGRIQEIFMADAVPTEQDDVHRAFRICKTSGKLATANCPAAEVTETVFDIYPAEADDWVREQGIAQPPPEFCDVHGPSASSLDVAIAKPRMLGVVGGVVPIVGNARAGGQQKYWLEFGEGMNPGAWRRIGGEYGHRVDNGVLEQWDTTGLDGLYTLRLSVLDGGALRQAPVPVMVDNISPTVTILNPEPDKVYELEKDEWINIQVYATDNTSMGRVEFFLDDRLLGFSTVAPYTLRWIMTMSDTRPNMSLLNTPPGTEVLGDQTITTEVTTEGSQRVYTQSIQQGSAIAITRLTSDASGAWKMEWPDGRTITSQGGGYTETHRIHVVAHDAAGNRLKSEPVTVHVIHEKKRDADQPAERITRDEG